MKERLIPVAPDSRSWSRRAHVSRALSFLVAIAVSFALAGCGDMSELGEAEEIGAVSKALTAQATIFNTGGAGLNVRAGTSTSTAVVNWVPEGQVVTISCQKTGQTVSGTNLWDYLPAYGGYVSDAYVYTGYSGTIPGVPTCGTSGGCGSVTYQGYCDGNTLVWCENGALRSVNCSSTSRTCGWQDSTVGYNCLTTGGGSGRLTISQIVGNAYHYVSQAYGPTTFDGGYSYCHAYGDYTGLRHCGIDISIDYGTSLYVPENGSVIISGESIYFEDETNPSAGELRIQTGNGTQIILGHMSSISLWTGQSVSKGGYAGKSGTANGGHVHIEVRVPDSNFASGFRTVDPATYFGM